MESKRQIRDRNTQELAARVGLETTWALQKIARSLHRLDEYSCNYGLSVKQEWNQERLANQAVRRVRPYGFRVYVQGDPRGWPLYLYTDGMLEEYNQRRLIEHRTGIDACYSSVGIAVCPF